MIDSLFVHRSVPLDSLNSIVDPSLLVYADGLMFDRLQGLQHVADARR
jgi:hypothetical protein